jgi:hypothetical protein
MGPLDISFSNVSPSLRAVFCCSLGLFSSVIHGFSPGTNFQTEILIYFPFSSLWKSGCEIILCRNWVWGQIFPRVKCSQLTGSAVDLWLRVCVHSTYGSYKSFRRVNTHSGWHLTRSDTRWRACSRRDLAASALSPQRGGGGVKHTHCA